MATIEEIAESIINEAQEKANEISKEYTLKTKEALKTIQNEHKKRLSEIDKEKSSKENTIKKKLSYDINTVTSNAQSRGKFEFFEEIIKKAAESLSNMPPDEYSSFVNDIICQKNPSQDSEILFSKGDIKRLGKDLLQKISKTYSVKIKECNEPSGFIIQTSAYRDKITPETIVTDKKPELMQILGRYEASL